MIFDQKPETNSPQNPEDNQSAGQDYGWTPPGSSPEQREKKAEQREAVVSTEPVMHTMPNRFVTGKQKGSRGKKPSSSKKLIIWGAVIFLILVGLVLTAIILFNREVNNNNNSLANIAVNQNSNQAALPDRQQIDGLLDSSQTLADYLYQNEQCIAQRDEQISNYVSLMVEVRNGIINNVISQDTDYSFSLIKNSYPKGTFLIALKEIADKYDFPVNSMYDFWYVKLTFTDTCGQELDVWVDFAEPNQLNFGELHDQDDWLLSGINANTNQNANQNDNSNINQNANQNNNTNQNTNQNSNLNINTNTEISDSQDSDNDRLTDVEEVIYTTQDNLPDSDADGYLDGEEVQNGYSPKGSGTLAGSDLVDTYTNDVYNYSILYPSGFLAQPTSQESQVEVLFTATSGEYIQVKVEDNPSDLTPAAWFMARYPGSKMTDLAEIAVNGLTGILSPNKLSAFLARGDQIYVINYNYGNRNDINYRTTFKMMYKSFQPLAVANNSNSNSSRNANLNNNTNNNTNTNVNGNSNANTNTNSNNSNANGNTNLSNISNSSNYNFNTNTSNNQNSNSNSLGNSS